MMTERIVLGGALLASADSALCPGSGLRIVDGWINAVDTNDRLRADFPDAEVLDARDLLLLPGFINTHMHSYGLLSHGMPQHGAPVDFFELLDKVWWPYVEDRLDGPMIEASMALACAHMIRGGVTSFCDVLEAPNAPAGVLDAEARVVERAGLRAVLMTEASERIDRARGERLLEENARFVAARRGSDRIRGMLCTHTSFSCSESFIDLAVRRMHDLGCDLHLHLSESPYEPQACLARYGERPVMWYDRLGLLSDSLLVSQAVAVDEAEIERLHDRGVRVSHQPISNCEVGGGVAPVPAMIRKGIRPGLGMDGFVNNPFEVMRAAFLIHKGAERDLQAMTTLQTYQMATAWGAAAMGFPNLGRIEVGCPADLIGVHLAGDTPVTAENVVEQVVLYRDPQQVQLTVVDGTPLMKDGELLSLDVDKVYRDANQQALRLWGAA